MDYDSEQGSSQLWPFLKRNQTSNASCSPTKNCIDNTHAQSKRCNLLTENNVPKMHIAVAGKITPCEKNCCFVFCLSLHYIYILILNFFAHWRTTWWSNKKTTIFFCHNDMGVARNHNNLQIPKWR